MGDNRRDICTGVYRRYINTYVYTYVYTGVLLPVYYDKLWYLYPKIFIQPPIFFAHALGPTLTTRSSFGVVRLAPARPGVLSNYPTLANSIQDPDFLTGTQPYF